MRDTTFDYTVTALKETPIAPEVDNDVKVSMQNKLSTLLTRTQQSAQGTSPQGAINQTPQGYGRTV